MLWFMFWDGEWLRSPIQETTLQRCFSRAGKVAEIRFLPQVGLQLVFAHDIDQHVHVHADGTSMYLSCFFLPNALNILNQMKFLVALAGQLLNSCLDHARAVPDFWNWCA